MAAYHLAILIATFGGHCDNCTEFYISRHCPFDDVTKDDRRWSVRADSCSHTFLSGLHSLQVVTKVSQNKQR